MRVKIQIYKPFASHLDVSVSELCGILMTLTFDEVVIWSLFSTLLICTKHYRSFLSFVPFIQPVVVWSLWFVNFVAFFERGFSVEFQIIGKYFVATLCSFLNVLSLSTCAMVSISCLHLGTIQSQSLQITELLEYRFLKHDIYSWFCRDLRRLMMFTPLSFIDINSFRVLDYSFTEKYPDTVSYSDTIALQLFSELIHSNCNLTKFRCRVSSAPYLMRVVTLELALFIFY